MKSAEGRHVSALMRSIRISQLKWRRNFQTTDGWNEWGGGGAHVGALPTFGLLFARPFRRSLPFPLWLQLWREYLFAVFYRTAVAASKKGTRKIIDQNSKAHHRRTREAAHQLLLERGNQRVSVFTWEIRLPSPPL